MPCLLLYSYEEIEDTKGVIRIRISKKKKKKKKKKRQNNDQKKKDKRINNDLKDEQYQSIYRTDMQCKHTDDAEDWFLFLFC